MTFTRDEIRQIVKEELRALLNRDVEVRLELAIVVSKELADRIRHEGLTIEPKSL